MKAKSSILEGRVKRLEEDKKKMLGLIDELLIIMGCQNETIRLMEARHAQESTGSRSRIG
jgi:hypothetical protein